MLRTWCANHSGLITNDHVLNFCSLFAVDAYSISARLGQIVFMEKVNSFADIDLLTCTGNGSRSSLMTQNTTITTNDEAPFHHISETYHQSQGMSDTLSQDPIFGLAEETLTGMPYVVPTTIAHPSADFGPLPLHRAEALIHHDSDLSTLEDNRNSQVEAASSSSLPTAAPCLQHELTVPKTTVKKCVRQFMDNQNHKHCGMSQGRKDPSGKFQCTLGCGRRFERVNDWMRHESIIWPQDFYVCSHCNDQIDSSSKVFGRADKMKSHLKVCHPGHLINPKLHKIEGVKAKFPSRCRICSKKHLDWNHRCRHLVKHFEKGEYLTFGAGGGDDVHDDHDDDDDSDSDFDDNEDGEGDDHDDDNNDNNEQDLDGVLCHNSYDDNGNTDTFPAFGNPDDCHQSGSFSFEYAYEYPDSIPGRDQSDASTHSSVASKGLRRISAEGGTAVVSKARVRTSLWSVGSVFVAVKQFTSWNKTGWEREVEALRRVQKFNHDHIIRFVGALREGRNDFIFLEWAEGGNLRELWSRSNPPHQKETTAWFGQQLSGLADALRTIHAAEPYGISNNGAGIRHGDLKPENILRFPEHSTNLGVLKIADFGLATFHESRGHKPRAIGSTITYSLFALDFLLIIH